MKTILRFRTRITVVILLIVLSIAAVANVSINKRHAYAKDNDFEKVTLTVSGIVQQVFREDLDGDGKKDLIIVYLSGSWPDYKRWIAVFWYDENSIQRSYSFGPDQVIAVDPNAVLVDIGNLDGDKTQEIIYFTSDGIKYHRLEDRKFGTARSFYDGQTFVALPDPEQLPGADFVKDWDGDGKDEVLVPQFRDALYFHSPENAEISEPERIQLGTVSSVFYFPIPTETLSILYKIPTFVSANFDGDDMMDLVLIRGDQIAAFSQNDQKSFPQKPSKVIDLNLMTEKERQEQRSDSMHSNLAGVMHFLSLEDFNKDNKIDIVVSRFDLEKGFLNPTSKVHVYFNGKSGFDSGQPTQTLEYNGAFAFAFPFDYNGDDKPDLVVGKFEISIGAIVKLLLTRKLTIDVNVYYLNEEGRFPAAKKPDEEESFSLGINFKDQSLEGGFPNPDGDFNGDGMKDIIVAPNREVFIIRLRDSNGMMRKAEAAKVKADIPKDFINGIMVDDLDGDNKTDVILRYPRTEDKQSNVIVYMNRKEW